VTGFDYRFTDGFHSIIGNSYNFAWQAGTGFGYSLTNAVTLSVGYRYFDYGTVNATIIDTALTNVGPFSISQGSHEFRAGIRVNVWGFRSPWL
jgi:opacity protein-like surface antigen